MTNTMRYAAGIAIVAAIAVGVLSFGALRADIGGPSPAASTIPVTTAGPTRTPAPAAGPFSFTSPMYGYTVTVPAGWRVTASTAAWRPSEQPTFDVFAAPVSQGDEYDDVGIAAQPVPVGMTDEDWLLDYAESQEASTRTCKGPADDWTNASVGSLAIRRLDLRCTGNGYDLRLLDVAFVIAGAGYMMSGNPTVIDQFLQKFQPGAPAPSQLGLVAWGGGRGIWVVNSDGTDIREVVPSAPRVERDSVVIGWVPDGSRVVYTIPDTEGFRGMGIGLADGRGSEVAAYQNLCPIATQAGDPLASCVPELELVGGPLVGISPDGGRVAYVVSGPRSASDTDVLTSAIAVLDLATGRVTTLDATRYELNWQTFGNSVYGSPTWSADGTRILFTRGRFGPKLEGEPEYDFLTVNDDGGNLRAIAPPDAPSSQLGPWSTWDGRVIFIRWTKPGRHSGDAWVADADGGNPTQLEVTIPALTAAGCMICPYPVKAGADPLAVRTAHPFEEFLITTMYWQPSRASQP